MSIQYFDNTTVMIDLKSKTPGMVPKVILGLGTSELKEQEDRKLDSENELIWSNDLN